MERISYKDVPTEIFTTLRAIEDYLDRSTIEKKLRELICLRISQLNGCAYCVDMHHKALKHCGETELRLSSLVVWRETPYFSPKERAILAYAEVLTGDIYLPIEDKIYAALETFYTKKEISILTLIISQINTWNRLMKAFQFTPGLYKVTEPVSN